MKRRLDTLLVERGLAADIKEAQALIGAGKVLVNDGISDKAGTLHKEDDCIEIKQQCRYVSRGGLKLEAALLAFQITVSGKVCVDIGASSGGFTDCLLQHGAEKVFAVDVAYGQFSWKLRNDSRVIVIERFNARHLTAQQVPLPIDLAVIDASFISLTKLLPPLIPLFKKQIDIVTLVKPQFELPREKVGKGGVVRDGKLHQEAIDSVAAFCRKRDLTPRGSILSPILGPKGNREFLLHVSGDAG